MIDCIWGACQMSHAGHAAGRSRPVVQTQAAAAQVVEVLHGIRPGAVRVAEPGLHDLVEEVLLEEDSAPAGAGTPQNPKPSKP